MSDKLWWLPLVILPVVTAVIFAGAAELALWSPEKSKVTLLCDDAVRQLLTTRDEVELRRAIFLINWFDCGVRSRLP